MFTRIILFLLLSLVSASINITQISETRTTLTFSMPISMSPTGSYEILKLDGASIKDIVSEWKSSLSQGHEYLKRLQRQGRLSSDEFIVIGTAMSLPQRLNLCEVHRMLSSQMISKIEHDGTDEEFTFDFMEYVKGEESLIDFVETMRRINQPAWRAKLEAYQGYQEHLVNEMYE
jgi:hypothetical protein